jgi:hypothetical protein
MVFAEAGGAGQFVVVSAIFFAALFLQTGRG